MTDFDRSFAPDRRRKNGIFYTSSGNIRKCIAPLLENVTKENASRCTFFDPACGNGNFLVETKKYLEEKGIATDEGQYAGIEIEPAAAKEAKKRMLGARIVCGNALTMDWSDLDLTPSPDLFIFGNPPFAGDYNKGPEQQREMDEVFSPHPAGKLDYCAAWYLKSAKFLNGSGARFAFVSTNSITQGVQVEGLFKPVFDLGWRISFAWPSVLWDHRDAAVYVVIIGFTQQEDETPKLYYIVEDEETDWGNGTGFEVVEVKNISPNNLKALPTVFVKKSSKPISELPCSIYGNKFADGGGLVLKSKLDRVEAEKDDRARKYIRKYIGAEELIHGKDRWCLWLANSTSEDRTHSKVLKERLEIVKKAREKGQWKDEPAWLPVGGHQPNSSYLAVPKVFSERRQYATAGIEPEDVIASDELYLFLDPTGFAFSVIETSMFMAWQDLVGGRLKEDYRFSNTLVWNTFPLPALTQDQKDLIIEGGRKVLEARDAPKNRQSSLADLYDPANMPPDLKKAHEALDKAVDLVFAGKPLKSEEERQKVLLEAYEKMTEGKHN